MGIVRGYKRSPPAERAAFGLTTSLASTIAIARGVTYIRERQRPASRARSRLRRLRQAPSDDSVRVHHFVPGVALMFASGAVVVITRTQGSELHFSIPFGIGAGLTLDEFALLIEVDNAYWRSEWLALAQAGCAAIAAIGLSLRFAQRGANDGHEPEATSSGGSA